MAGSGSVASSGLGHAAMPMVPALCHYTTRTYDYAARSTGLYLPVIVFVITVKWSTVRNSSKRAAAGANAASTQAPTTTRCHRASADTAVRFFVMENGKRSGSSPWI